MKVRHKGNHNAQHDCVGEGRWLTRGDDMWIIQTESGLGMIPKEYFEPVPAETWHDVTAEVETHGLFHEFLNHNGEAFCLGSRYRLRKVKAARVCESRLSDVFIVEKKS
jgi:hypothetical protein